MEMGQTHSDSNIHPPVFLVGAERSGTTLLRLMLQHHPSLSFHPEFEFAVDWIPDGPEWPDLQTYYDHLDKDRIFRSYNLHIDRTLSYPDLIRSFLQQLNERDGKPLVGATVHRHFDKLLRIWPDARFIYLIRDGRDVARSAITMGWSGNMWTACDRWIEAEQLWQRLSPTLPPDRRTEISYESLIRSVEPELGRLCEFMGLSYDPAMLDYARHSTYDLPDPKLIGQWQRKLTKEEIRLAEARIGPMLVERGYALSGLPELQVSDAAALRLRRRDRWQRLQFRRRRYGNWLLATEFVSRRLGLRGLHRRAMQRWNAVDSKYVK